MSVTTAVVHLLAVVLVLSGAQKVVSPAAAQQAMRDADLPLGGRAGTGRMLGALEMTVGLVALVVSVWWAAVAVAFVFGCFAAFVQRLRAVDDTAGCGCFGASSTPPGTAHLVSNLLAVVFLLGAAMTGYDDVLAVADDGLAAAVLYPLLLAVGAGLVLVAPAVLADLADARQGGRPTRSFSITSEPNR